MTAPYTLVIMSGQDMDNALPKGIGGFDKNKTSFIVYSTVTTGESLRELINDATGFQAGSAPLDTHHMYMVIPNKLIPELEDKFAIERVSSFDELALLRPQLDRQAHENRLARLNISPKKEGQSK